MVDVNKKDTNKKRWNAVLSTMCDDTWFLQAIVNPMADCSLSFYNLQWEMYLVDFLFPFWLKFLSFEVCQTRW